MADFLVGDVYFRLTYSDKSLFYPTIESFVYVGKDLSSEESDDRWYFQFANSYGRYGSVTQTNLGDRRVCCLTFEEACRDMLTVERLHEELKLAEKRRRKK